MSEHNAGMKVSNLYISHFDLDDIQWDNNAKEYGKKRTLDERKALLQEILYNNDEWIIEGV